MMDNIREKLFLQSISPL